MRDISPCVILICTSPLQHSKYLAQTDTSPPVVLHLTWMAWAFLSNYLQFAFLSTWMKFLSLVFFLNCNCYWFILTFSFLLAYNFPNTDLFGWNLDISCWWHTLQWNFVNNSQYPVWNDKTAYIKIFARLPNMDLFD